jgi:hypothetical protein
MNVYVIKIPNEKKRKILYCYNNLSCASKKNIRIDKTKMSIKGVEELEDVSEAGTDPSMWEGLMRTSPPPIFWWCLYLRKAFAVRETFGWVGATELR